MKDFFFYTMGFRGLRTEMKSWLWRLKEKLCNGPPGPPGSIEYIRWRSSKDYEEECPECGKPMEKEVNLSVCPALTKWICIGCGHEVREY